MGLTLTGINLRQVPEYPLTMNCVGTNHCFKQRIRHIGPLVNVNPVYTSCTFIFMIGGCASMLAGAWVRRGYQSMHWGKHRPSTPLFQPCVIAVFV